MRKLLTLFKKNLLWLACASFLLVSSSALVLSRAEDKRASAEQKKDFPPIPILTSTDSFPVLSAQGALAVDAVSGVSLYEKNPDLSLLPASTTKIMTALVSMDQFPMDKVLVVNTVKTEGQRLHFFKGNEFTAENLLYALLVYSANDAAEVFADNYPGGKEMFVLAMNAKVKEIGLKNTHFDNPSGLDGASQSTTARDLVKLTQVAMQNPEFAKIVGTKEKKIESIDGKVIYNLSSTNELLSEVDGVVGVKTGWTEAARENLVTQIERNERKIVIAVLGSQDRFGETKELIDWIFGSYEWTVFSPPF